MPRTPRNRRPKNGLPGFLRPLFWDTDFLSMRWPRDRDQVTARILASADWKAITWLRRRLSDEGLREWFLAHKGRGLDPPRLRFWELVLDLPEKEVDLWIETMRRDPWHRRTRG